MSSSFGQLFRVTTFGESHGAGVGVVVDGMPPRLSVDLAAVQAELDRRRPGQSRITTQRKEGDRVEILSGVGAEGLSLGTPIAMLVRNEDGRGRDYAEVAAKYRPSHADFAYDQKYGIRAVEGGGRASARETIGRVAAGALARAFLTTLGVEVIGWVASIGPLTGEVDPLAVTREEVEANIVRCPDAGVAAEMVALVEAVRKDGDSVGGTIGLVARGVPAGWGEPVFDKLEADLGKGVLSLPACKGFEIGGGFAMSGMRGSEAADEFASVEGRTVTRTNHSGGVQGGISNGMPILLRAAFKPTATIARPLGTVDVDGNETTIAGRGRHDPCVLPRAVPMVEAMALLVLADHALRQRALTTS